MATWNEFKDHVRRTNPEIGNDIDDVEENSRLIGSQDIDENGRMKHALEAFQHSMDGEAERAGFRYEDEIAAWITEGRRKPLPPRRKILRNAARCNHCGDVIESIYRHNFVTCSCGRVSVDGGLDYLRRCAESPDDYTELSETAEPESEE